MIMRSRDRVSVISDSLDCSRRRLSDGGVECYGSAGVDLVSLIEFAVPIGAMPWSGSSALFSSPAVARVVISVPSNSAGFLVVKNSVQGEAGRSL
jgi:hypothetical protein